MDVRKKSNCRSNSVKDFFDSEKAAYLRLTDKEVFRRVGENISKLTKGTVVDLGGGPTLNYISPEVYKIIKVDISDSILLAKGGFENLAFVMGDASCIPLKDGIADTVIMQHLLHHLSGTNVRESVIRIQNSLREAFRILGDQGRLLIVEPCFHRPVYWMQKKLYPLLYAIYSFIGFPPVYFSSLHSLMLEISEFTEMAKITIIKTPLPLSCREGWSIEVPYWLSLSRICVISATKQSAKIADI